MEPRRKPPEDSVTYRVLRELGAEPHPEEHDAAEAHPEEEEEAHPDERWLVSYADMMTLLFGLFVMLYSMVGSFDIVRDSASRRFGGGPLTHAARPSQAELDALKARLDTATRERQAAVAKTLALKSENEELRARLADSRSELASLRRELAARQPKAAAPAAPPSSLTVVMKWSTAQHDLDLVVKDPEGRVFDFKHRHFAGHPGRMVLHSRHGPGAELWQADRIIPGIYEATAIFYNPYGNAEPARFSFSVLTAKGFAERPEAKLSFDGKARATLRFSARADGSVKFLP